MHTAFSRQSLSLFFSVLSCFTLLAFPLDAFAHHYELTYLGRSYNQADDTTTFSYEVSGTGQAPALSHFTAGIPVCDPSLELISTFPDGAGLGIDGSSGLYGVKWDFGIAQDATQVYSYTLAGNVAEGPVQVLVKAGQRKEFIDTYGPACDSNPVCNDDTCNIGDTACTNGATESEIVGDGQKCSFKGTVRNVGEILNSNPTLFIDGTLCSAEILFPGCGTATWEINDCFAGEVLWSANDTAFVDITDISCCDSAEGQQCSAGVGICSRTGTILCDGTCDAVPGDPNPAGEICGNDLDDDCDGEVDEIRCVDLPSISGKTLLQGANTPISGVTVSGTGGLGSTQTDGNADYSFTNVSNGSYTLTASKTGYIVVSDPNPVTINGTSLTNQNFILACAPGYAELNGECIQTSANFISGRVTFEGTGEPIFGVDIFLDGTVLRVTDVNGAYLYDGLDNGQYQVTLLEPGYVLVSQTFSNPVEILNADQPNKDFILSCAPGYHWMSGACVTIEPTIIIMASDGTYKEYVLVEWDAAPDATSYTLYRSDVPGPIGDVIATNIIGTTFQDTSAVPDKRYYYTAISNNGVSSNQDEGWRPGNENECQLGDECYFEGLEPFACANANGFLRQINIATVINRLPVPLSGTIEYRDLTGATKGSINFTTQAEQKMDFLVNHLGLTADSYGTVCITMNTDIIGAWSGGVTLYKSNFRNGEPVFGTDFDFVLYYPFTNGRTGEYTLPLNTFHLGVRRDATVANWIRISDAIKGDGHGLSGVLEYIDASGVVKQAVPVNLPDGGRFDYAGHVGLSGPDNHDAIGMARFKPALNSANEVVKYYISVGRYFYECVGASCNNFYTALVIPNRPATSVEIYGGISTMNNELSVVEFNNPLSGNSKITLDGYHANGVLAGVNELNVPTLSTRHALINRFGGTGILDNGEVGSAAVFAEQGMVSAISMFYQLNQFGILQYAYSAPMTGSPGLTQLSEYNSFIGNKNTAEFHNSSNSPMTVKIQANDAQNNLVFQKEFVLPAKATIRELLTLPANTYGTLRITADAQGLVFRNYVSRPGEYVLAFPGL